MKITGLEIFLLIIGPIVLRPVITNNAEYFFVSFMYGVLLGIGRVVFSDLDEE